MYRPVVSKIRVFDRSNKSYASANREYVKYIATRPGVDLSPMSDNYTYTKYIAERPRSSGLWGNIDTENYLDVASQVYEKSQDNQLVYRAIVSLSPQDAVELGYTDKKPWMNMVNAVMPDIAEQFNISIRDIRYIAAYHREESHPHVHIVFWSEKEQLKDKFISVKTQNCCREIFSREIFKAERENLITEKTLKRNATLTQVEAALDETGILSQIPGDRVDHFFGRTSMEDCEKLAEKMLELKQSIPTNGRKYYQYMPPEVKEKIDLITKMLLERSDIAKEYRAFKAAAENISRTYSSTEGKASRVTQSAQEDLNKRIGNLIVRKTLEIEQYKVCDIPDHLLGVTEDAGSVEESHIQNQIDGTVKEDFDKNEKTVALAWQLWNDKKEKNNPAAGKQLLQDLADQGNQEAIESLNVMRNIESGRAVNFAYALFRSAFSHCNRRRQEREAVHSHSMQKKKKHKRRTHMEELEL